MALKGQHEDDFLLRSDSAKILFHDYAEKMPIIDYHCHIQPREIYEDRRYDTITQVWLGGDHYKWRVMRANGVPEKYITGDASDWEKFEKWVETLTKCIGNPLYHWSYLELKRYFGWNDVLTVENAQQAYDVCNRQLQEELTVRELIRRSNVESLCTTDDPLDSLVWHRKLAEDKSFEVKVYPAFRPDSFLRIEKEDFLPYIRRAEEVTGIPIADFESLCSVLERRIDYFHDMGCRVSDHALETCVYEPVSIQAANDILQKRMAGEKLSPQETEQYKTGLLSFLAACYQKRGWVMQIHYGCLRNNNRKEYRALGADTGYDAVAQGINAEKLSLFLDSLYTEGTLPQMIFYPLDANEFLMVATMVGCFQGANVASKLQLGSGWWFNDTKRGMENQLQIFAEQGVLGNFVGMLTDSRSFLSYTRHEYFRRVLCNLLGDMKEHGECFESIEALGKMVQDISYFNAKRYFHF